jgi:hypothetical protein
VTTTKWLNNLRREKIFSDNCNNSGEKRLTRGIFHVLIFRFTSKTWVEGSNSQHCKEIKTNG